MLAITPEGDRLLAQHENLRVWLNGMEARPSMQATAWDRLVERTAA